MEFACGLPTLDVVLVFFDDSSWTTAITDKHPLIVAASGLSMVT
jgi:hypothetical protein